MLIGSAPSCDICLDEPQLPPVAYLICNFERSVEVWPTSAIAFPRWGVMLPGQDLVVGRTRISVNHPSLTPNANPKSEQVDLNVQFDWHGSVRKSRLRRPVTIMGSDQPSVLRLQGQRLHKCDHALVAQGSDLWLINLSHSNDLLDVAADASRESSFGSLRDSQLTRLCSPGDAGRIGGVTVSIGAAKGRTTKHESVEKNIKHVVERSAETPARPRVWRSPETVPNQTPIAPSLQARSLVASTSYADDARQTASKKSWAPRGHQTKASDKLDAMLMDRMVQMRRRRVSKHRNLINSFLARVGVAGSAAASIVAASSLLSRIHE